MDILKLVRKVSQLFIEDDPSGLVEFLRSDPDVRLFNFFEFELDYSNPYNWTEEEERNCGCIGKDQSAPKFYDSRCQY
jgi:hypothetical protein